MIPIEDNMLFILFRRGKIKHIKNLFEKGEIYINTVDFIRKCDDNEERSDPDESIFKREYWGDAVVKFCDVGLDINKHGIPLNAKDCVIKYDNNIKGNIFCLSGIFTKDLIDKRTIIDFNTSSFGESLLIISNPKKFVKRVVDKLTQEGYEGIKFGPVEYFPNDYSGSVGFFKKHQKFSHQNEFRFFIPNPENKPIKINIGPIKDIAIMKNKAFVQFYFTDDKIKTFNLI